MFIDEAELDDFQDRNTTVMPKYSGAGERGRSSNGGRPDMDHLHMHEIYDNENDDGLPPFRSAGGLSTPSSSRARMLAQQREIQLKKRQNNMLSSGMVRSSMESNVSASTNGPLSSSPLRQSVDSQFTPAVRQFSAPKSVRDASNDAANEQTSEFSKRAANKQSSSKAGAKSSTNSKQNASRSKSRRAYSDDEDEEDEEEDDYEEDARYRRRREARSSGGNPRGARDRESRDDSRGGRGSRSSNQYDEYYNDEDGEDRHDRGRSGGVGGSKGGARGHRSAAGGDRRDEGRQRINNRQNDDQYDDERYDADPHKGSKSNSKWTGAGKSDSPTAEPPKFPSATSRGSPVPANAASNAPAAPVAASAVSIPQVPPDLSDLRRFLSSPLPKECGIVQCYIRRNKSGSNKLFPIYSLYLKEDDVFLMASKKRPNNKTSNYLITCDQNDLNRTGRGFLGKLRSNFVGTEFQVYDDGISPKGADPDDAGPGSRSNSSVRCEMAAVMYAANVLGSRGPRKMQVALPGLNEHGEIIKWRDGSSLPDSAGGGADDILTRMKDRNMRDLNYLINKPPRWNEQVGAYVLNFNGRVTMASVKNFQLVDPDEQNAVVLQFGRVGKDEFTMDMQHPISPFQAFGVTLSSFDSKIACD